MTDTASKLDAGAQKKLEDEMKASLVNGRLPCAQAFRIARKFKVAPGTVGDAANKANIRISNCQLGCFP